MGVSDPAGCVQLDLPARGPLPPSWEGPGCCAHPQEDKGPVGQSHPKRPCQDPRMQMRVGSVPALAMGRGALVQDLDEWPRGRSQNGRSTFQSLSSPPLGSSQGKGPHLRVRVTRRGRGLGGGACRASGPHQVLAPQWLCSLFSSCLGRQVKGQGRGWRRPGSGELAAGAKVPVPLGPGRVLSSG